MKIFKRSAKGGGSVQTVTVVLPQGVEACQVRITVEGAGGPGGDRD